MVESILNIKKCKKFDVRPEVRIEIFDTGAFVKLCCPICGRLETQYVDLPEWDEEDKGLILEEAIDHIVAKWNEAKECGY